MSDKSWIYGEDSYMIQEITPYQKLKIISLEKQTGYNFNGKTQGDAIKYIKLMEKRRNDWQLQEKYGED